jgi:hypothetical protein
MRIGTKSLLFGAHCLFIHPLAVAIAWTRLFGPPLDGRLWVAFCVHDLGYFGKNDLDGAEGKQHVWLGTRLMARLFDAEGLHDHWLFGRLTRLCNWIWGRQPEGLSWSEFCLYHSRYFATTTRSTSRLCAADKLAFAVIPRWLYLTMVRATGEIHEYRRNTEPLLSTRSCQSRDLQSWHRAVKNDLLRWVAATCQTRGNVCAIPAVPDEHHAC